MHAEKVSSALAACTQSLRAAASAAKYSRCSSQPSILSSFLCQTHPEHSALCFPLLGPVSRMSLSCKQAMIAVLQAKACKLSDVRGDQRQLGER